jgi:hypothetical protein
MRGVDRRTQATAQLSNSRQHRGRAAIVSCGVTAAVFLLGAVSIAFAAEGKIPGRSAAIFFADLGVLLLVGRGLGELMQRIGQPAVMGQLLGGLLLGPSVFGLIWPDLQHALFPQTAARTACSTRFRSSAS